jgi:hypothetical protein
MKIWQNRKIQITTYLYLTSSIKKNDHFKKNLKILFKKINSFEEEKFYCSAIEKEENSYTLMKNENLQKDYQKNFLIMLAIRIRISKEELYF